MRKYLLFLLMLLLLTGCSRNENDSPVVITLDKEKLEETGEIETEVVKETPTSTPEVVQKEKEEVNVQPEQSKPKKSNSVTIQASSTSGLGSATEEEDVSTPTPITDPLLNEYQENIALIKYPKSFGFTISENSVEQMYCEYKESSDEWYLRLPNVTGQVQMLIQKDRSYLQQDGTSKISVTCNNNSIADMVRSYTMFRMSKIESVSKRGVLFDVAGEFYIGTDLYNGKITVGDGYYIQSMSWEDNGVSNLVKIKTLLKLTKDSSAFGDCEFIEEELFKTYAENAFYGYAITSTGEIPVDEGLEPSPSAFPDSAPSESPDIYPEPTETPDVSEDEESSKVSYDSSKLKIGCSDTEDLGEILPILTEYGKYSINKGEQSEAMSVENLLVYHCVFNNIDGNKMKEVITRLNELGYDAIIE